MRILLREVFIIANGLNLFHYSSDNQDDNIVKSNLTSGFLSALQSFSLQARDSAIEFFSSQDEYFLFTPLGVREMMLVCVFDRATNREFADSLIKQIHSIMLESYIAGPDFSNTIYVEKNDEIFEQIKKLTENPFDKEFLTSTAMKLFDGKKSISSLRIINMQNNEIYYENARPKPLLKETQISEFNLLLAALDKLCERLNYPRFELLSINCPGSIFIIYRKVETMIIMFSSGMVGLDELSNAILEIFESKTIKDYTRDYKLNTIANSLINLDSSGDVKSIRGEIPFQMVEIFISTVINGLDRFVSSYVRKNFNEVRICFPTANKSSVEIIKTQEIHQVGFR